MPGVHEAWQPLHKCSVTQRMTRARTKFPRNGVQAGQQGWAAPPSRPLHPRPQPTLLSWISMRTWCCLPLPPCIRQEFWGRLGPKHREGEPLGPMRPTLALEERQGIS